ncbi:hypothetical protein LSH36_12g20040 [Paralvinella palmiformis]|uniref:Cell division cycle 45 n=1 Tax=Paralvinella palmiformis TaxID=53620 RepID=A0AAD9NG89_9ANNE|nr:hypothetical protein LSH36_12g20040 [Paralvinella palmiformis]
MWSCKLSTGTVYAADKEPRTEHRVLVLVAFEIDALCACKILQYLFQCDHVLYTIVPVTGKQDLERAFVEHSEGVQVCLLMKEDDLENIPEFRDVFLEDESDEDDLDNDSDDPETGQKKRRFDEAALIKRMEKRKWEENRKKILFEYTEFSGYGLSSSLLLYDMAWKMSKDTNDLLWLAIIGVTEQYINQHVERDKYMESIAELQPHVSRLNHRPDDEESSISIDCLKVMFDNELRLTMYRHWSLFESLCHSEYTTCKFKIWTMKGRKRLHEFLADMGLPLVQCKQKFTSMDVSYKESVKDLFKKFQDKYSINEQDLFLPSFHAQYGYKNRYCATDVIYASEAVLQDVEKEYSDSDNFLHTLDLLNRSKTECMEKGIEMAKIQLSALVKQVQSFLDANLVISAGPFLYAFVQEGTPDVKFFAKPINLARLARFTLEAYCCVSRNKKVKTLPFVLGAHHNSDMGTMLVIGIPPVLDKSLKNCFGKAFEQAAATTNSRTLHDFFDSHIIELKSEDRSKFFDALISLLQ